MLPQPTLLAGGGFLAAIAAVGDALKAVAPAIATVTEPEVFSRETPAQLFSWSIRNSLCLLGKHPAGYGLLEGGRNSLLESAQEATLMSVPT